jgi:hypothetical protein
MRFLCDYLDRLGALLVLPEKNEYESRMLQRHATLPSGVTPKRRTEFLAAYLFKPAQAERATLFRSFQCAISIGFPPG